MASSSAVTFLDAVRDSLKHASAYNAGDVVAPAAILWTDVDGQWKSIVDLLRPQMPELLTLGTYSPDERIGPAIWLRCIVDRTLEPKLPESTIPIIYMPGVSRQTLRAGDECPDFLKPLVELQYRGTLWTQKNGKDWTIEAFLVSEDGGLDLDVARDQRTRNAMLGAISQLALMPIATLRGRHLEAEDFDKLMINDTTRDLLVWMNDPDRSRQSWSAEKWAAFRSRCRDEFDFDPEKDGEIIAGEKLGKREGAWKSVWNRFAESPSLYPSIPNLLRHSKPGGAIMFDREPWPDENENEETALRTQLLKLASQSAPEARKHVRDLEKQHGERRTWIWARLGESPLAIALQYLNTLAHQTESALGGDTADAMAELYAKDGYLADDAAMRSLAAVKSAEDQSAVDATVRALYLPWLEDAALHLQKLFVQSPPPTKNQLATDASVPGQCILFCDGLRFDLAQRLVTLAEEKHLRVTQARRWAALPTVTATAKPAVSPIAKRLTGAQIGTDFKPEITDTNQSLTHDRFQKLLEEEGLQIFASNELGLIVEPDATAWTEFGEFDKEGHSLQRKLATRLDDELALLLERIVSLLESGWKEIKVVTDHGWLLMPGGLPVIQLPKYLTESRWSRCASVKAGAKVGVPLANWFWNPSEQFAVAPGANCFLKGNEYAHGGISLQECVIPVLTFAQDRRKSVSEVTISEIKWLGLRCRAVITPVPQGIFHTRVFADLRTKAGDASSSLTGTKEIDNDGKVGLLVADDSLLGTVVCLVLLESSGRVIAKKTTTVGGEKQ